MKKQKKGFTLLELTIVLAIIGIISVGFLQGSATLLKKNKISSTKSKLNTIQDALMNYLLVNKNLPCPAGLKLTEGSGSFGVVDDCAEDTTNGIYVDTSNFIYGAVPTATLNLADEMMKDEWGNKFSYVVHINYTSAGTGFINMDPTGSAITVYTEGTTNTITNKAVFAVISHGENGYGGWSYVSGSQAGYSNASTEENKNIEAGSFDGTIVYTKYDPDAQDRVFDDIVRYKTKNQLIIDTDWEDVGCFFDTNLRNTNEPDAACDNTFAAVSDEYLDYYEEYEWDYSDDTDCCIAKCYKYGRMGYFLKGSDCD